MTIRNGGKPDASYCLYGAEAMLKRLQALIQEADGVRHSLDIEYVHRMRVASRRLRSALALFDVCYPKKQADNWQKEIKRITKSLGAARDTDVQLEMLDGFKAGLEDKKLVAGIDRLVLRLRQKRTKLQEKVVGSLDRFDESGVYQNMEENLRQVMVRAKLDDVAKTSDYLYERSYSLVMWRLEELLAYEMYVYQPEAVLQHHSMRIAAKRLRYTMEIFEELYGKTIKPFIKSVKQLQEILGDMHDSDVWIEFIPQFTEEEKKRTLEYAGDLKAFKRLQHGLLHLQSKTQEKRDGLYKDFVEFWKASEKDDLWRRLKESMLVREAVDTNETKEDKTDESDAKEDS